MSASIYKFPFAVEHRQHIVMPPGAQLLTVGVQDYQPVLWASAVDEGEYTGRRIEVIPTGGSPPDGGHYVGTFTLEEGPSRFVGHVYDLGERTLEQRGLMFEEPDLP